MMERRAIVVYGTVQGVGFRPFVHDLASRLALDGFVKNHAGNVLIEVEGETEPLDQFLEAVYPFFDYPALPIREQPVSSVVFLKEFQCHGTLVRAFYYTAVIEDQEFSSVRPLLDWLDYNGFTVVTKPTKEFIDANGHRKVKGNMDIELTVNAMELADHVDQIVLFSGDGDFRSLVEAVQRRGVRVTVVSTISSQPPMIADELRRQADVFTDLTELQPKLGRDPSQRSAPREANQHATHYVQRRTSSGGGNVPAETRS